MLTPKIYGRNFQHIYAYINNTYVWYTTKLVSIESDHRLIQYTDYQVGVELQVSHQTPS